MSTTDHDTIQKWAEKHGGKPARIVGTADEDPHRNAGLIRIEFRKPDDKFEEIAWNDFYKQMDENGLAMILQHQRADGSPTMFNRFVKLSDHPEAASANHAKK
jgi:hypothetical protein